MEIKIEELKSIPTYERETEIVERKGLGHPDFICDSVVESISLALSREYLEKYGVILHHNIDKALLAAGTSNVKFGGGKVDEPIYIIVAGRAVNEIIKDNKITRIPVGYLTVNAIREFIKQNFRYLDPDRHILIDYKIRPGSIHLQKQFEEGLEQYRMLPESVSSMTGEGICLDELGLVCLEQGNIDCARKYNKEAQTIYKKINSEFGMSNALKYLSALKLPLNL